MLKISQKRILKQRRIRDFVEKNTKTKIYKRLHRKRNKDDDIKITTPKERPIRDCKKENTKIIIPQKKIDI